MTTNAQPGLILILEDDAGIAQLEKRGLERAGYEVRIAATVAEAREILGTGGVDLLVLDFDLNESATGLDFYSTLRSEGFTLPAILATGFADQEMLTQAIRIGIRDFLPKNREFLDYLVPIVERVLAQIHTERELAEQRTKLFREQTARAEAEAEKRTLAIEDRRKDEFLAMLAHELRNPLAAISSAVHVSRANVDEEQRAWSNDVITRQVRHLAHLIDDLLDISRIRLGKIELRLISTDVSEVIAGAVEAIKPLIERKNHVLTVVPSPRALRVEADPIRLEQIVVNLLTNAAKYTDNGGRISLSTSAESGQVVIRVKDTGMGIAAEMLPQVFELFLQVEDTLDRSQGGLGIGLTLVQKLVALHGGTVTATSEGPGRGSEFIVRIPESNQPMTKSVSSTTSESSSLCPSRRVLVVDDNADSALGLARLLRISHHEVEVAHDGPTAIALAATFQPDFLLLDIGLPGMDGHEVASTLRRNGFADATIVALSGYEQDKNRSQTSGFDHHFIKPIDLDRLLTMISG